MTVQISFFKLSENIGPRVEKIVLNSVINFRRVTDFWLSLETQVSVSRHYNQSKDLGKKTNIQTS
jgi:hypothetical protein